MVLSIIDVPIDIGKNWVRDIKCSGSTHIGGGRGLSLGFQQMCHLSGVVLGGGRADWWTADKSIPIHAKLTSGSVRRVRTASRCVPAAPAGWPSPPWRRAAGCGWRWRAGGPRAPSWFSHLPTGRIPQERELQRKWISELIKASVLWQRVVGSLVEWLIKNSFFWLWSSSWRA